MDALPPGRQIYVQRLRIEAAKRRLERTGDAIDKIGLRVGYEELGFFRRLFRRIATRGKTFESAICSQTYRSWLEVDWYAAAQLFILPSLVQQPERKS